MHEPGRGRLRAARAGLVGTSVALVSTSSHVIAGGHGTSWLAVAPVAMAVGIVAWVLADRRLTHVQLIALLCAAQVGAHALSSYLSGHALAHDAAMTSAHVAAAAVSAMLLGQADRLLWLVTAWATPLRAGLALALMPQRPRTLVTPLDRVSRPILLVGSLSRRGPPAPVI